MPRGNAEVLIWLKLDGVGARLVKVCATAARSGIFARPGVFITPAVVGAIPYRMPPVIPGSMAGGTGATMVNGVIYAGSDIPFIRLQTSGTATGGRPS